MLAISTSEIKISVLIDAAMPSLRAHPAALYGLGKTDCTGLAGRAAGSPAPCVCE